MEHIVIIEIHALHTNKSTCTYSSTGSFLAAEDTTVVSTVALFHCPVILCWHTLNGCDPCQHNGRRVLMLWCVPFCPGPRARW